MGADGLSHRCFDRDRSRSIGADIARRGAPACLGDDDRGACLRTGRLGHRRAPCLDLRRHVLGLRDPGLGQKTKGQFTREELDPLAKVNVESLKEYAYFTYAKVNGKRQRDAFLDPVDYYLDYDPKETVLTLHFTLPFKTPVKAKALDVEIYDPEFFIDFGFAEKDPARLVGAPAQCAVAVKSPDDGTFPASASGSTRPS